MREVEDALRSVADEIATEAIDAGLFKMGEQVRAEAVKNAPVDTGFLRSSAYTAGASNGLAQGPTAEQGTVSASRNDARSRSGRGRRVAKVGFTAEYAIYVHEGNRGGGRGGRGRGRGRRRPSRRSGRSLDPSGRKGSKYLQRAIDEARADGFREFAETVRRQVRRRRR